MQVNTTLPVISTQRPPNKPLEPMKPGPFLRESLLISKILLDNCPVSRPGFTATASRLAAAEEPEMSQILMLPAPTWRPPSRSLGFLSNLSDVFVGVERRQPGIFPELRSAACIFVSSDYGGEHKDAQYHTISFLMADIADCAAWQPLREHIRARHFPGGRRMAFKNLNDRQRLRALDPFLYAADSLRGLSITFAIHKAVGSLFVEKRRLDPSSIPFEPLKTLSPDVAEKFLRITHLLGLLVAGLSGPGQDILWITDEDAIAANPERLKDLANGFGRVCSNCLDHDLGHLRVGTAKQDKGDLSVEDLLSVPDMAAGALSAVIGDAFERRGALRSGIALPPPEGLPRKTRRVVDWFSGSTQPLRRVVVKIDQDPATGRVQASHLRFRDAEDIYDE